MMDSVDFAGVGWDSAKTCPNCFKYMMTDGTYLWCGVCDYAVGVDKYDPTKINISLNVDDIVVKIHGQDPK